MEWCIFCRVCSHTSRTAGQKQSDISIHDRHERRPNMDTESPEAPQGLINRTSDIHAEDPGSDCRIVILGIVAGGSGRQTGHAAHDGGITNTNSVGALGVEGLQRRSGTLQMGRPTTCIREVKTALYSSFLNVSPLSRQHRQPSP